MRAPDITRNEPAHRCIDIAWILEDLDDGWSTFIVLTVADHTPHKEYQADLYRIDAKRTNPWYSTRASCGGGRVQVSVEKRTRYSRKGLSRFAATVLGHLPAYAKADPALANVIGAALLRT